MTVADKNIIDLFLNVSTYQKLLFFGTCLPVGRGGDFVVSLFGPELRPKAQGCP
jgi:hypothetical protein